MRQCISHSFFSTGKAARDNAQVTPQMRDEIKELLKLFGLPFVESPMEAEAECAYLETLGLVDGVVTDDADVFLFGGQNIYKNIFEDAKYVEMYLARDIALEMGLERESLINIALLLGSDYTVGIKGIGGVNALEILRAFPATSGDNLNGLKNFREWVMRHDTDTIKAELSRSKRKKKTRKVAPSKKKSKRTPTSNSSAALHGDGTDAETKRQKKENDECNNDCDSKSSPRKDPSGNSDKDSADLCGFETGSSSSDVDDKQPVSENLSPGGNDSDRSKLTKRFKKSRSNIRKKWGEAMPSSFPSRAVVEAYVSPTVTLPPFTSRSELLKQVCCRPIWLFSVLRE